MKKKILTGGLVIILLASNLTTFAYYSEEKERQQNNIVVAKEEISTLREDIQTKSTEIAHLGETVKEKDQVIDEKENVISEKQETIDKQKAEIISKDNKINALEIENSKNSNNSNFKNEKKGSVVSGRTVTVQASAYIAMCTEGCTGRTATGVDVSKSIYYNGYRVIAVDPNVIPLNSLVQVDINGQTFKAMAIDKGGAIKGNKIDVLVGSESEANKFGRKNNVKITIIN